MGQLKHDGQATQGGFTAPAGDFPFGDLFRINGFNGIALTHIAVADTVRTLDLEISPSRVWYVKLPAGVTGTQGTYLYWTAGAGLKRGDTDLTATPTGTPVCVVEETKDANNYAAVRVLNVGP
jgi:hypothetical protein